MTSWTIQNIEFSNIEMHPMFDTTDDVVTQLESPHLIYGDSLTYYIGDEDFPIKIQFENKQGLHEGPQQKESYHQVFSD